MTQDLNALPAHVWPKQARRRADGAVTIGGVALTDIASEFGTPTFVVDEEDFRSRCREIARAFGAADRVHYASKAFLTSQIVRWVHEEGLGMDVASAGELEVTLRAGFPAERIAAHGNNKDTEYLKRIVSSGVGVVVLDAGTEIDKLIEVCRELGRPQAVMVRVKPGIEAHTHEFIATSHEDQKFGFSLASGSAFRAAQRCVEDPWLDLVGLHCHVGSQVFDAEGFSLAAERVLELCKQLHSECGVELPLLDLGGGYGIAYTEEETALDIDAVAGKLLRAVEEFANDLQIPVPEVHVEPGRAIAGPSTVTLYEVGAVKDVHVTDTKLRRYVAVDGGMSDNIRPMLYDAAYEARLVNRTSQAPGHPTRVVGSHCESGDILLPEATLPADLAESDLLAVAATGAYCYSMSSRYNMLPRPAVVSVRDGKAKLMVRRETIEDFLALETELS